MAFIIQEFADELRIFLISLVHHVDGFIDENFLSREVIMQNLIIEGGKEGGAQKIYARLEEDYEYNLFNNLLSDYSLNRFYHYTSMESLYRILNSGSIHLNSLVGLNDKSEVNLVNNYMRKELQAPGDPISTLYHNTHFIFCFSENRDQLNQWRLYGEDASGVMLEFDIDHGLFPDRTKKVCKITYSLDMFGLIRRWLDRCKKELNIGFGFYQIDNWKFFYKNKDYSEENEVRLLIKNPMSEDSPAFIREKYKLNRYGIIVPYLELGCIGYDYSLIRLKSIMLGPKCKEADLKAAQIRYMISRKYPEDEIRVEKSAIEHYR